jgi:lecithin:retinol acyltransferase
MFQRMPVSISLVSRRKLAGPGRHFGILLEFIDGEFGYSFGLTDGWNFSNGPEFVDLSPQGVSSKSLSEFAQGHDVRLEHTLTDTLEVHDAHMRLCSIWNEPQGYHLLKRNCEHAARYVVLGTRRSPQVDGVLMLAGLALFCILVSGG